MDAVTKDFSEFTERVGEIAGRDTLESRIIAILFLNAEDLCMDDLMKMTGYSLASVCNKVRALEKAGLITRKTKPGTKKIFLSMEKDSIRLMMQVLKHIRESQLTVVRTHLPAIIAKHKGRADPAKITLLERHLHQITKVDRFIEKMMLELDKVHP
jgi:DNA-binding transcriptional regulator GbsR (MarR family)